MTLLKPQQLPPALQRSHQSACLGHFQAACTGSRSGLEDCACVKGNMERRLCPTWCTAPLERGGVRKLQPGLAAMSAASQGLACCRCVHKHGKHARGSQMEWCCRAAWQGSRSLLGSIHPSQSPSQFMALTLLQQHADPTQVGGWHR